MNPPQAMTFDEYCSAVREASVSFVLTRREEAAWGFEFLSGSSVAVQIGSDGGASVADGVTRSDAFVLLSRYLPSSAQITFNGEVVGHDDFVVLTPGCHFIFSADASRTWISVSLPQDVIGSLGNPGGDQATHPARRSPCVVRANFETKSGFLARAEEFRNAVIKDAPEHLHSAAESRLSEACIDVLAARQREEGAAASGQNLEALRHVSRALQALQTQELGDRWHVGDLARTVDVGPRTLLRDFHRVIGMGPIRYLRYRQLNIIRRALIASATQGISVTEAMHAAGATEFGRVAGAYKALFGESPSETLRQALRFQKSASGGSALHRPQETPEP